jgi:hypothetical protein
MSITPKAIQDLLDELESSKQSRLRAWNVLQRLRSVLSDLGDAAIPSPAQKTFDDEGQILERCFDEILLHTCTIITGEPNEFVRQIHTRMPVILQEEHHDAWLSGEAGKEVLVPFPADRMKAWPFSARVNRTKDNDAEIIAPIELESVSLSENSPQLL